MAAVFVMVLPDAEEDTYVAHCGSGSVTTTFVMLVLPLRPSTVVSYLGVIW